MFSTEKLDQLPVLSFVPKNRFMDSIPNDIDFQNLSSGMKFALPCESIAEYFSVVVYLLAFGDMDTFLIDKRIVVAGPSLGIL